MDLKPVHKIHDDLLTIIGSIKIKDPNTKLTFDKEVMQLNALLFNSIRLDDTVYLLRQSNLRRSEYFHDSKHIERNHINRLVGNIKFSLRKALGIKIDKISAYNKRPMDFGPTRQRMMSEESRKINYRQSLVNSNSRSLTEGHPAFDTSTEPIPFNRNEAVDKFVSLLDYIFQGK